MFKTLSNGVVMPMIGFGVFQTKDGDEAVNAVKWALEAGYRHIDTAKIYGNEVSVGKAIKQSGVPREEIFVTTKLWNEDIRNKNAKQAFEDSLKRLELDYVDLYLIHWPTQGRNEAWSVMQELYNEGKIRSIGVSNFHQHHFEELMQTATIMPMVNQIESNPAFNNDELIAYYQQKGIVVQAWSPLGGTGTMLLDDQRLLTLAKKYNKSPAQIVIRWHLQKDVVVLPKSIHEKRIYENLDVFDFEICDEDMSLLHSMNINQRSGSDPDNFNF